MVELIQNPAKQEIARPRGCAKASWMNSPKPICYRNRPLACKSMIIPQEDCRFGGSRTSESEAWVSCCTHSADSNAGGLPLVRILKRLRIAPEWLPIQLSSSPLNPDEFPLGVEAAPANHGHWTAGKTAGLTMQCLLRLLRSQSAVPWLGGNSHGFLILY